MADELNRLAGYRISPAPRLALYDFKSAKTNNMKSFAFLQVALDEIKQQIDQTQRIAICQAAVT